MGFALHAICASFRILLVIPFYHRVLRDIASIASDPLRLAMNLCSQGTRTTVISNIPRIRCLHHEYAISSLQTTFSSCYPTACSKISNRVHLKHKYAHCCKYTETRQVFVNVNDRSMSILSCYALSVIVRLAWYSAAFLDAACRAGNSLVTQCAPRT